MERMWVLARCWTDSDAFDAPGVMRTAQAYCFADLNPRQDLAGADISRMVLQKNCCTKKRKSTEVTVAAISADSKCQRLQRSTYNGCQQARDDAVFAPALRP